MILVIGATGTIGVEVVKELARWGVHFRALVHDPRKADAIRLPGVEIVQGDLADAPSLAAVLTSADRVFLVSSPSPDQVRLENAVIDASARAGVEHLVKSSILHADPQAEVPYHRWNGEIEEHLRESGLAYTILRPNLFMQYLPQIASYTAAERTLSLSVRDGRISMIDARDIGEVAALCLTHDGHEGQTYTLTGPEALSLQDAADLLTSVLGRRVTYVSPSPEEERALLVAMGLPQWAVDGSLAFLEYYARDEAALVTPEVPRVTGHPARTFRQFAQDHAELFLGAGPPQTGEARKAA